MTELFDLADQKQDHSGTWIRAEAVQKRIEALTAEVTRLRQPAKPENPAKSLTTAH